MRWKDLLKIENLSVRNPLARIIYSSVPIVSATALALAQQNANPQAEAGLISVLTVLLAPIAGVAGNTLAEAISNKFFSSFKRSDILENGDLHKAVSDAIGATILLALNKNQIRVNPNILKKLSKVPTDVWQKLIEELETEKDSFQNLSIEEIDRLYPKNLPDVFAIPAAEFNNIAFLNKEIWEKVLRKLCSLHGISTSNDDYSHFTDTISFAAQEIEKNFCEVLKHTLIANITKDGKAYANLQMKMVGEILYYVRETQVITVENKIKLEAIEKKIDSLCSDLENGLSANNLDFDDQLEQIKQEILANQQIIIDGLNEIIKLQQETLGEVRKVSVQQQMTNLLLTEMQKIQQRTQEDLAVAVVGIEILLDNEEENKESIKELKAFIRELKELLVSVQNFLNQPKPEQVPEKLQVKSFPQSLPYFTGREDVLRNIDKALETNRLASLDGIHGLGKSSVVNEFANNLWRKATPVIFIRATRIELDTYIGEVINDLQIPLSATPTTQEILDKFRNWLATNKDWLLILDNVDAVEQITDCHFPFDNGYVLLTSNNPEIHTIGHKVEIKSMSAENAMLLLYRHYKENSDLQFKDIPTEKLEIVREIAAKFGNSPLGMLFVGSYLAAEQESFTDFLTVYEDKEENLLVKYQFLSTYQHKEVATAFLQTFERITVPKNNSRREMFITAAIKTYLKLCVYLSPDNIPEEFLQKCLAKIHPKQSSLLADKKTTGKIRKSFKSFSLFERDGESKTLSTHPIIQEVMRFQIKNEELPLLNVIAETFREQIPHPDYINKKQFERFKNHLETFLDYLERNKVNETDVLKIENDVTARLCGSVARYYELFGQYEMSLKYYEKFKNICEKSPAINEVWMAISYNNLSSLYQSQGKYDEAESLCKKELAIYEKVFGVGDSSTSTPYNNLGEIYRAQGRHAEAAPLLKKATAIGEQAGDHLGLTSSYNNLALIYKSQKKYAEAEQLYKKALAIRLQQFGREHPETAKIYSNLADFYMARKDYFLAELLNFDALAIYEKILGPEHVETAKIYNGIGALYYSLGRYKKAKYYIEKTLAVYQAKFGENHSRTISVKKNLRNLRFAGTARKWSIIIFLLWLLWQLIKIFRKLVL